MKSIDECIAFFEETAKQEEESISGWLEDGWQKFFLNLTPEREKEMWEGRKQTSKEAEEKAQDCRNIAEWLRQAKKYTEWIPIKTKLLTEKEKEEMGTESDCMYDCPLPDDGEEVEITTHLGDVTLDVFYCGSDGCYFEQYCDDGDVLAWRHKPEPYKGKEEE